MAGKTGPLEEYVLVFPQALLEELGYFQGLCFETERYLRAIFAEGNYRFLRRREAERDPGHKQPIPYVIISHEDQIFCYYRGSSLSEERLRGYYSLGIGGHISPADLDLFGPGYQRALIRELREEIEIKSPYELRLVALLNDDSNEVGRVHFGLVYVASLLAPSVVIRERGLLGGRFIPLHELRGHSARLENWSRLCLLEIEKLLFLP